MTTKPIPRFIKRRMCHTHRQYPTANCPLCTQALKAFLDKETNDSASVAENRNAGPRALPAVNAISDGDDSERNLS